ncbi:MAG: hypothetical protein K2K28_01140, partial [Clostridia bacterium]|nr:hypothetical protein [Clostridia bacterium]
MKIKNKRNLLTIMLSVLCAVLLLCSVGLLNGGAIGSINATAAGTTIAEIAPNSGAKPFSGNKLAELYDAILGSGYSNRGTFNKVKKNLDNNGHVVLGSGVSTKALTATDLGEIYVTFGGVEWQVTYLTTNRSGEVIVDLMAKNSAGTSSFSGGGGYTTWSTATYANISSIYSTSYIRAVTLGNGGTYYNYYSVEQTSAGTAATATAGGGTYARFTTGDLSSYIVEPSNVDYQEKESWVEFSGETGANYNVAFNLPCDAYGTPSAENYFMGGVNNDYNNRPNLNTNYTDHAAPSKNSSGATVSIPANPKANYNDWQNDKVWLPSNTEVYMWGVENSGETWLRSGAYFNASISYYMKAGGGTEVVFTSTSKAVRPAIHLNLTKADAASDNKEVPVPQNVTVDYATGVNNWLDTLEGMTDTSGNAKYTWIDSTLHNDSSKVSLVDIKYTSLDALGNTVTANTSVTNNDMTLAGKYEVTLEIPSTATDYEWRGGGTGTKTFTITVTQKSVPYTLQLIKGGSAVTTVEYKETYTSKLDQSAVSAGVLPANIYELWYKGVGTTVYTESKTAPTEAGTYTLALKAAPDATNAGKNIPSNYKLTGSALNFSITPKEITKLNAPAKQVYDGSVKTFTVNGYDPTIMTAGKVNATTGAFETGLPTGLTSGSGNTFEASNAGKYTLAFRLPLDSTDGLSNRNYVWKGETDSFITLEIEVEQRTLEVDWTLLAGQTNWTIPVTATGALSWKYTTVTSNQPVPGEDVKLQYRFYYTTDGDSTASTPVDSLDVKDIHDKNGVTSRPQGSYTVELVIADNTSGGGVDGKNYKLGTSGTLIITLGAGKVDFDQLIKQVTTGTALPADYDSLADPLEYMIAEGTEAVVTQKFDLGWASSIDYIKLGTSFGGGAYKYEKWDGSAWGSAGDTNGAG